MRVIGHKKAGKNKIWRSKKYITRRKQKRSEATPADRIIKTILFAMRGPIQWKIKSSALEE